MQPPPFKQQIHLYSKSVCVTTGPYDTDVSYIQVYTLLTQFSAAQARVWHLHFSVSFRSYNLVFGNLSRKPDKASCTTEKPYHLKRLSVLDKYMIMMFDSK